MAAVINRKFKGPGLQSFARGTASQDDLILDTRADLLVHSDSLLYRSLEHHLNKNTSSHHSQT